MSTDREYCNCRDKTECPLNGNFKVDDVEDSANVKHELGREEKYILEPRRACLKRDGITTDPLLNWQSIGVLRHLPVLYGR